MAGPRPARAGDPITRPIAVNVTRDRVVVVDEFDAVVGEAEKIEAHRPPGLLHRAFSVVLHDKSGRMLLQQRSDSKHHYRSIWANSCCGHPGPGQDVVPAARQRVRDELGVHVDVLDVVGSFRYQAIDPDSGLVEHEIDHVLVGLLEHELSPNPDEVKAVRWMAFDEVVDEIAARPNDFAPWLRGVLETAARVWDPAVNYPDLGLALDRVGTSGSSGDRMPSG